MSTSPSPDEPNDDYEVLNRLFGKMVRTNRYTDQLVWYIGLALVATLAFWILSSLEGPIALKAVIFFIVILGLDLAFSSWLQLHKG